MASSPHLLLTDTQAHILGSTFPPSSLCRQFPQSSQIHTNAFYSQEVDSDIFAWSEYFCDVFSPKPEPDGAPLLSLEDEAVEHSPAYNPHVLTIDFSSRSSVTSDFDDESTSSPSISPITIEHNPQTYNTHIPAIGFSSQHSEISDFDDESSSSFSTSPIMPTPSTTWSTCVCGCDALCIPQRLYPRPRGDPLEDHLLGELIVFRVSGRCGILLTNALRGVYTGLSGRDEPMFVGSKTSISIRLEWPGCSSWAQQMRTKDWKRKPSPITKAKLAKEVAKKVDRFLKETRRNPRGSQADSLSPYQVDISRLALVALQRVSVSSWQPYIRIL